METIFNGSLWQWQGQGAWYFITVPEGISQEIREVYGSQAAGFGSIKVLVKIGNSSWNTSIFPDKKSGCYFLPIKKSIRQAESLAENSNPRVTIKIM